MMQLYNALLWISIHPKRFTIMWEPPQWPHKELCVVFCKKYSIKLKTIESKAENLCMVLQIWCGYGVWCVMVSGFRTCVTSKDFVCKQLKKKPCKFIFELRFYFLFTTSVQAQMKFRKTFSIEFWMAHNHGIYLTINTLLGQQFIWALQFVSTFLAKLLWSKVDWDRFWSAKSIPKMPSWILNLVLTGPLQEITLVVSFLVCCWKIYISRCSFSIFNFSHLMSFFLLFITSLSGNLQHV